MHKPGKYVAHVIDADIWKNNKGNPVAVVAFGYTDDEGNPQQISWMGQTTGGAREITVNTLVLLGFSSNNLADLTRGKEVFNHDSPYEIVLENEIYEGKTRTRVKYVNLPGGSGFREKMSREEAVQLTAGLNLGADFMQARQKLGKPVTQVQKPVVQQAPLDEKVPW